MANDDKMIMVVDRVILFADEYFQGFAPSETLDYEQTILDNYHYEKRSIAEKNSTIKQPIAYCLILNPETKQVYTYRRSSKPGEYKEKRLRGMWSWGIGGHVDNEDMEEENPIRASLLREISEEINITNISEPQILGYINDDETAVGQVHFGLLYLINTTDNEIKPKDAEIAAGEFKTLEQLEELVTLPNISVEEWSTIALIPLSHILLKDS